MSKYSFLFILLSGILFQLLLHTSIAQESDNNVSDQIDKIIAFTNKYYGKDDGLINGKEYFPKHPLALGHPYFISDDWIDASLYIKGIAFHNIEIKYNIEDNIIVLRQVFDQGLIKSIVLNNSLLIQLLFKTTL